MAPQLVGVEQAYLVPSTGALGHRFGGGVALDGDTALVGTEWASIAGRVYVYERVGELWSEVQELAPGSGQSNDYFGQALDIDGDTAVIGAWGTDGLWPMSGAAYVFVNDGSSWTQVQRLAPHDPEDSQGFGFSVAIEGDTIVVGALWDNSIGVEAGAAYVFERANGMFSEVAELHGSDTGPGAHFGIEVALEGGRLLVGAPGHDHAGSFHSGGAFVFERSLGAWIEQAELVDPLGTVWAQVGRRVALSGDLALIGSPVFGGTGVAHVFSRSGATWTHEALLSAPSPSGSPGSNGLSGGLALDGELALLAELKHDGADPLDPNCDSGAVHVFTRSGGAWPVRDTLTSSHPACDNQFGWSLDLQNGVGLIGAPGDGPLAFSSGAAHAVSIEPAATVSYCTAGASALGCTATLTTLGAASAAAPTGFTLIASSVEAGRNGLFFFGVNGGQAVPWGNGSSYRCVTPPTTRCGLLNSNGTTGPCDGSFSQDLNAFWTAKPAANPGLGTAVQAQLWYRDPLSTSNQASSFSDAVEFSVGP